MCKLEKDILGSKITFNDVILVLIIGMLWRCDRKTTSSVKKQRNHIGDKNKEIHKKIRKQ